MDKKVVYAQYCDGCIYICKSLRIYIIFIFIENEIRIFIFIENEIRMIDKNIKKDNTQ